MFYLKIIIPYVSHQMTLEDWEIYYIIRIVFKSVIQYENSYIKGLIRIESIRQVFTTLSQG